MNMTTPAPSACYSNSPGPRGSSNGVMPGPGAGVMLDRGGRASINLAMFVAHPFSSHASLDFDMIERSASTALRLLDDRMSGQSSLNISVDGLADALIMLGVRYDSSEGRKWARRIMRAVRDELYAASIRLAHERGPLPGFNADQYLQTPWGRSLPTDFKELISTHGLRYLMVLHVNSDPYLPVLFGNGCSVGFAPVMNWSYSWAIKGPGGKYEIRPVESFAYREYLYMVHRGKPVDLADLPEQFVTALDVRLDSYRAMLREIGGFVDGGIDAPSNEVLKQLLKRPTKPKPPARMQRVRAIFGLRPEQMR